MKKQQGLSLESFLLALVVVALISATTIPPLMNLTSRYISNSNTLGAVDDVFAAMTLALNESWETSVIQTTSGVKLSKCRTVPSLSVNKLISQYQLKQYSVSTLRNLSINVESTNNIATNLKISFDMPLNKDAIITKRYLDDRGYITTVRNNTVFVKEPIDFSDNTNSDFKILYFDSQTGCFNENTN